MTSLSYDEIFSNFLGRVTDYDLASMGISDAYSLMNELLHKSIAKVYIRRLFFSISADDLIQKIEFEMKSETDEESDKDFTINILAKQMVVEWIEPQVRSKVNLSQFFGTKEFQFYSQANHIAELRGMLEDTEISVRNDIRDRGYIYNEYLDEA